MIGISWAITTHNQGQYIQKLLSQILNKINQNDEIIIVDDFSDQQTTLQILHKYKDNKQIKMEQKKFSYNFAQHKNYLFKLCTKDYIFNIDADEKFYDDNAIDFYRMVLQQNTQVDLFYIPRINIVDGISQYHIQ